MLAYQQNLVDRMKQYLTDLERALNEERWVDADQAVLGIWLANDELQKSMPHGLAGDDPGFFA